MTSQDQPLEEFFEPEGGPDADADPSAESALRLKRGGPKVFMMLTCGFIALLCCVGGCLGGTGLGLMRARNLDETRAAVGAPEGWTVARHSAWPWKAYADLSGPADAEAFTAWLGDLGAAPDGSEVADCLTTAIKPCTVDFTVDGRSVSVVYGPKAEAAYATVTVT